MTPDRIDRYVLLEPITSATGDSATALWRGHDEVLDRQVSIRTLRDDDPRAAAFLGAARAAALVDDRRLLRILDILQVPASPHGPAVIAVVSEWATGQTLPQYLAAHVERPEVERAVGIVDDVARAVAAGLSTHVAHGRLRPSSVIVTDAGEVRVRGLAVDAALFGPIEPGLDPEQSDVDGLGSLLYLLVTGTWPGRTPAGDVTLAPRAGGRVLPPSHLRADVPRHIDDCVARSVRDAPRPRGARNAPDAHTFAAMLGIARDHVVSVPEPSRTVAVPLRSTARVLVVTVALLIVGVIGLAGWQMLTRGSSAWGPKDATDSTAILTQPAVPAVPDDGIERLHPIVGVRSFDPAGDDNGNGKPDGRKGLENDEEAIFAGDGQTSTAWTSDTYRSADFDGKGGVGVIVDIGATKRISQVDLTFADRGAPVQVRVADRIYKDPGTWNLLASAGSGADAITLRAPRPLTGRYVLVWFPQAPATTGWGRYQVGLSEIAVRG